jgi:hypothetical protein
MLRTIVMRTSILIVLLGLSLEAQNNQPVCTGFAIEVDVRCSCIKDPKSKTCELVKAGFYDGKMKPIDLGLGKPPAGIGTQAPRVATAQPARPQQARVVPLAHKDYLRFIHPNAQMVIGFDFGKLFQSQELLAVLFGDAETQDARAKVLAALKEMDHLWLSVAGSNDIVILMTGKFEQGVAANMFYSQGVYPVFLGGAQAMMVGPEPSIQAALARLAKPAAANGNWAARRARELSKDHETWIVSEPASGTTPGTLPTIRQFALGFRLTGESGIDGELVADSDAGAEKIAEWVDRMKALIREKTGVGALDSLVVQRTGPALKFAAKGDSLLAGDAGKAAVSSDFGVELYSIVMSGFPGTVPRTVAEDKLLAVKAGMKREEVLSLVGPPLAVSAIQGLDIPRETWTYQIPFGKQLTVRLDGGVVTAAPR